jgi:hypothetical protein
VTCSPETAEQRCWWHKIGNVLAALPKSAHPGAKRVLAEIYNAEDKDHAIAAAKAFNADYGTKWPKAVAKVIDDLDVLLTFYDFLPSTGSTCAPPTRSSPPSPPSGSARGSPRDPAPGRPASEWRSRSSNPPRHAGAPSTPLTSSPWSEPARSSRTESSSNDPNQTTNLKPHDTPLRRSLSTPGIIAARRPAAAVYFGAIVALRVGITEALSPVFRLGRLEMPWPSSRRAGTMPCASG